MGAMTESTSEQRWIDTCNEQNWDHFTQTIHLEGFLRSKGLMTEFAEYAVAAAKEENDQPDDGSAPAGSTTPAAG